MKSVKIMFRSCAVVKIVGSSDRPFGLDKPTLILKCLKSLIESCKGVKNKISIEVIDDSSGEEFVKKMEKILINSGIKFKIHSMNFRNNGKSLNYTYSISRKVKEDLIYFCEDDYFHLPYAIPSIIEAYESKIIFTPEFAVFPIDYPGLYTKIAPALIFMGKYNHWRSTSQTTGTFVITSKIFRKYEKYFFALAEFNVKGHGGEKETINRLWQSKVPCISPLPSFAAHMHTTSLSLLIDWKNELNKIKTN